MDYIEQTASSDFHPAGTCSLNKVVDNKFTVMGLNKLRIADASVIHEPISGNPQITACSIGIKAAKIIAQDYQLRERQQLQNNLYYINSNSLWQKEQKENIADKDPKPTVSNLNGL